MATAPDFKQQLTGVIGQPIAENPSQPMVEAAYRHHGLPWRYLTIEVAPAGLCAAVLGMRAMGFRGGNCTIPHKVAVIPHLDGLGESARLMGAVNCVVRRGDQLIGENTDGKGFVQALRRQIDPAGKKVVILGAGGAARAIAVELALCGASALVVVNRSAERREALVALLRSTIGIACTAAPWAGDYAIPADAQVVVNATSIGPVPGCRCPPGGRCRLARARHGGCRRHPQSAADALHPRRRSARLPEVIGGLEMLVDQGAIGIAYWTGIAPDAQVMRQALEDVFSPGQRAASAPG